MSTYQKLVDHFNTISHFQHLASICHWDQATMMPTGGNMARANALAELSLHIHQLARDPKLVSLFTAAYKETFQNDELNHLREMKREYTQASVLPNDLIQAKSLAGSTCEHAWRQQRQSNDWQGFRENFIPVVELAQQEAMLRGNADNISPYDAMLQLYEPGMTSDELNRIFDDLTSWLPQLTQEVMEKQKKQPVISPFGYFSEERQNALGKHIMALLGFNFEHGRLDISTHPFCGGVSQDVRITTRYDEHDFQQSLMGIIHETGHALYEQGLPKALSGLPSGKARSMGIHESQSLFFEMQIGRSAPFIDALSGIAATYFSPEQASVFDTQNLRTLYTRVKPGYIRVDADEVTYPAHVILRYEIERDLMNKTITLDDIPELWNEKMVAYLGLSTHSNMKDGCMQDIHWTDGSFGYFPSYTLGAMYAAQLMASMSKTVDVETCCRTLDFSPVRSWLEKHIWRHGSTLTTNDLIESATGEKLNPVHFKRHLVNRYLNN